MVEATLLEEEGHLMRSQTMNVTTLYAQVCRCVMQASPNDGDTWNELQRLLPLLRQALSCCVCAFLLTDPVGPTENVCQHHVCKNCVGGKMRLKPACGWCKDHDSFEEKPCLTIYIKCFRKLCEYLATSGLVPCLPPSANGGTNNLMTLIQDVLSTQEEQQTGGNSLLFNSLIPAPIVQTHRQNSRHTREQVCSNNTIQTTDAVTQTESEENDSMIPEKHAEKSEAAVQTQQSDDGNDESLCEQDSEQKIDLGISDEQVDTKEDLKLTVAVEHDYPKDNKTMYSVTLMNDINPKLKIRRTPPSEIATATDINNPPKKFKGDKSTNEDEKEENYTPMSPEGSSVDGDIGDILCGGKLFTSTTKKSPSRPRSNKKEKPKGCRCGTATPTPGKLTCCGQRCPCYSAYKGCTDCRCRGCRNPRRDGMQPPPHILIQQQSVLQIQNKKQQKMDSGSDSEIDVDV